MTVQCRSSVAVQKGIYLGLLSNVQGQTLQRSLLYEFCIPLITVGIFVINIYQDANANWSSTRCVHMSTVQFPY